MKLLDNPFYILKCLPESSKSTILEQADNRSFDIDEQRCTDAKNILLNPKKRLEAEICWFPGLDFKDINERINHIYRNMQDYVSNFFFIKTKFYLAESNLLAFGLDLEKEKNVNEWSEDNLRFVASFLCSFSEKINIEQIKKYIIESRAKAKFPSNISDEEINFYINEQKKYYKESLYSFLKKVEQSKLISVLSKLIEESTELGKQNCKWSLLEEVIYDYELDKKDFFEKQKTEIDKKLELLSNINLDNNLSNDLLLQNYKELKDSLQSLNNIIYPIKLLKKSRGIDDEFLLKILYSIRNLSLHFANDLENYEYALRLNKLCEEFFSELRKTSSLINNDKIDLLGIINRLSEMKERKHREMNILCEWEDLQGKHCIKTDENSITINKTQTYNFKDITKISWGSQYNNFIIQFKTENMTLPVVLLPTNQNDYFKITNVLWEGSGKLLFNSYLRDLRESKCIKIADIVLYDYGMELKESAWFFPSVKMFTWKEIISVNKEEDKLVVIGPENYKLEINMAEEFNVYVISEILRLFFYYGKGIRISDTFEKNDYRF